MTEYNAKDMRSQAGKMLDEARRGEEVVIWRRGAERFVLRYEPEESAHPSEHQGGIPVSTSSDDLLEQLISGQQQTNDLLRQLVDQKDTDLGEIIRRSESQLSQVADPGKLTVTARVEEPEPAEP